MSFVADLTKFAEKAGANVDLVVRKVTFDVAKSVVDKSPVGNPDNWDEGFKKVAADLGWVGPGYVGGRFRANWQFGDGAIPDGALDAVDRDGVVTLSKLSAAIMQSRVGGVTYVANNLPYALRLEYGYSDQAPAGMVRVTAAEFDSFVRKATGELDK